MLTQTQAMETLSFLLGENQVPTTAVAVPRRRFIQETLREVYRAYPWGFAGATTTLTLTGGTATLPENFDPQHKIYAYWGDGQEQVELREINFGDTDMYRDGQYKIWLEPLPENRWAVRTKDTQYDQIVARYQTVAPEINATIGTPFNDSMALALGARRYVKLSQNPDADIQQDEALFQQRLNESIAAAQVNRPLRTSRRIYKANGYRLGEG